MGFVGAPKRVGDGNVAIERYEADVQNGGGAAGDVAADPKPAQQ